MAAPYTSFCAVIPAGGAGTRLWPVSRAGSPKFLHDLTGSGRTLLQDTVDRLAPLAGDRVLVVTGAAHADAVRAQLPGLRPDNVLIEPSARDSMAAIGLAAAVLEARDPDAIIGSFAADHVISGEAAFGECIGEAIGAAADGYLVTIGITPTHPATGFGYIQSGRPLAGYPTALHVRQFVEKPDAERAAAYVQTGEFRWNAGMFVVRASRLLELLSAYQPRFTESLRAIAAEPQRLDELWPTLPKIAIDHAIAEPAADAGQVVVVPGSFGWDDIGDFSSLGAMIAPGADGVSVVGDANLVEALDATGIVVPEAGRLVALLGIDDIVVVDTPDAILVTTRERAQEVKTIVERLKASGRGQLT
ncbi:mannose-1-phosphate guanylyltransferase [Nostocoides jenkinsii]|jgi:mannose-1-phosphate guanylyltransferase|uniref:Mannose-1-phosphate guanylyltransferase n=1 Tax=Nostocoides jenkinsii Ben 74 TaxID=1193518 RepID=A0A077M8F0_9MICO|nr:mannose-1-phosphate guanylyltransferase [Tetrasphaera jenkinsii]CCI52165.1 Mannose-1-phosphate guanylyltransferase [Tetrasphaera jenkinsii Ben 74]